MPSHMDNAATKVSNYPRQALKESPMGTYAAVREDTEGGGAT
jgi:hypothetical protein